MPKLVNSLPKYRKHRASKQAVVTLDGKDHYLGPHGTKASRMLYDRLIAEWLAGGRRMPRSQDADAGLAVELLLSDYWDFAQTYYVKDGKPTGELELMRLVMRDVQRLYADVLVEDFGPAALKAIRQTWIERDHARTTINQNVRRVTRIFRWGVQHEMVPGSVLQALQAVPGLKKGRCGVREADPVRPVDLAVVKKTIEFMLPITADMVRLQMLTGARPGEICAMRPQDIDRTAADVWEYSPDSHKTEHHGRQRVIFIGPAAQQVLKPYLLREASAHCFSPAEAVKQHRELRLARRTTPLSCGSRPGKRSGGLAGVKAKRTPADRYNTRSYGRAISNACDAAFVPPDPLARCDGETIEQFEGRLSDKQKEELKQWRKDHRWSPNQLRHTKATEIRKRFGLEAAQVILGHAAANTTEIYAARDMEKAREVARRIG